MTDVRNLRVYEAAEDLAARIEDAADRLDADRVPGLRSQMRRAAQSIPANLTECAGQGSDPQFLRGINIAIGSANELGAHLRRAKVRCALDPITVQKCEVRRVGICRMLESLARVVEERIATRENEERDRKRKKAGSDVQAPVVQASEVPASDVDEIPRP